jgi:hypothetical protein
MSSLQKQIAARLVRLSDACFTSKTQYAKILRGLGRNKHEFISTLPVFSNIGEPEEMPPLLKDRRRRLVVFGGGGSRRRVYEKSISSLARVCQALVIEEILDIGPPADSSAVALVNGVPVVQTGTLPSAEVSAILSDSIAGYIDYDRAFLAKSTIFAAYCAHRLIVVSAPCENSSVDQDGLEAGKHYWIADMLTNGCDLTKAQGVADNAYAWYAAHDLSVHARTYIAHLSALVGTAVLLQNQVPNC